MDEDVPIALVVTAAAAGDQAAWNDLVERYSPLVVSVVRGFRLSPSEIEDVAQTVWLRLVEHVGQLREPRALPGWIVTTVRRESLRQLASRRRDVPHDPLDDGWAGGVEPGDPDERLVRAERQQALLAGLAELPTRQRELLLLLMEDPPVTYAEVSRRSGIPVGAIGPTRARALERLRRTAPVRAALAGPDAVVDVRTKDDVPGTRSGTQVDAQGR